MIQSQRTQCKCQDGLTQLQNCPNSLSWLSKYYNLNKMHDLKTDYETLTNTQLLDQQQWWLKCQRQIDRDLARTFPQEQFFQSEQGVQSLRRVLQCIALYDFKVGYVQGMNFLVGALLYHSNEYVAFWNYVMIYEKLELRDIYLENLPGLSKHVQIVQLLCMSKHKKLYDHLVRNQVLFENFCTPWFLSLLAMVIPIVNYGQVISQIISEGWPYFYKMILLYLSDPNLLLLEGPELLMYLTNANRQNDEDRQKWIQILTQVSDQTVDSQFIKQMLQSFDSDKQTFLIKK